MPCNFHRIAARTNKREMCIRDSGWTVTGDQTDTQIPQEDKKFIMPDENVTVTGTWTFEATPPTGTPVYVYFQTV